jgi:hypothetical protein
MPITYCVVTSGVVLHVVIRFLSDTNKPMSCKFTAEGAL